MPRSPEPLSGHGQQQRRPAICQQRKRTPQATSLASATDGAHHRAGYAGDRRQGHHFRPLGSSIQFSAHRHVHQDRESHPQRGEDNRMTITYKRRPAAGDSRRLGPGITCRTRWRLGRGVGVGRHAALRNQRAIRLVSDSVLASDSERVPCSSRSPGVGQGSWSRLRWAPNSTSQSRSGCEAWQTATSRIVKSS